MSSFYKVSCPGTDWVVWCVADSEEDAIDLALKYLDVDRADLVAERKDYSEYDGGSYEE